MAMMLRAGRVAVLMTPIAKGISSPAFASRIVGAVRDIDGISAVRFHMIPSRHACKGSGLDQLRSAFVALKSYYR